MNKNIIDNYDLNYSSFSYLNEDENNSDKSINGTPLSNDIKENSKSKGVIGKIGGIGADSNEQTRNGRRYPLELWQNVEKSEYFIEGMANRSLIGEADHPTERVDYSISEGAIVLTKYEIQDDGKVYTEFDILDTLPGRTVKAYFDAGCKLGVSSRGLGEEIMRNGETIIDPDTYQFYCFDVVAFPAVKTARMDLLESTSPKRTRYIESMKREIEKCTNIDELKFIEESAKGADLYLDEIREAVETKSDKLNDSELNTKDLAKSIVDKIDKKSTKTKQDTELFDFLKAWLNENVETKVIDESFKYDNTDFTSIKDLDEPEKAYQATKAYLDQLKKLQSNATENDKKMMGWLETELKDYEEYKKTNDVKTEDLANHYTGKWSDICNELSKDGYDVDSAYKQQAPQNEEEILMYRDGKTYKAFVNKYFNDTYEILKDTIKEENNKIKISEPKFNKSDEDTPEVLDRDSDENLEILAEIQECINVKNSKIDELNTQIKNKTEAIKNLVKQIHNTNVVLQESTKEKTLLSKKYENLHRVNDEFSNVLEVLKSNNNNIVFKNKSLEEKLSRYEQKLKKVNDNNIKLQESLENNISIHSKVASLSKDNKTLKNNNSSLMDVNKKLEAIITSNKNEIKQLIEQNDELKHEYNYSLDKYIEAVCLKYNLQKDVLKRLLGETYSFEDIDKTANSMVDKINKMNALPFDNLIPSSQVICENIGLINTRAHDEELETFDFMLNSK